MRLCELVYYFSFNNVYHYVVYNDLLYSLTNIFDMTVPQMMIAYVMMNNGEQRQ
jgi:hypothetical protein